jgi:hypothetical protein
MSSLLLCTVITFSPLYDTCSKHHSKYVAEEWKKLTFVYLYATLVPAREMEQHHKVEATLSGSLPAHMRAAHPWPRQASSRARA